MGKALQNFTTVAAKVIDYAITDGFFTRRKNRSIKSGRFFNRVKAIIAITEIDVSVYRTMRPRLTVFRKEESPVESEMESLNIVECFLERQRSNVLTLIQQILDHCIDLAIRWSINREQSIDGPSCFLIGALGFQVRLVRFQQLRIKLWFIIDALQDIRILPRWNISVAIP